MPTAVQAIAVRVINQKAGRVAHQNAVQKNGLLFPLGSYHSHRVNHAGTDKCGPVVPLDQRHVLHVDDNFISLGQGHIGNITLNPDRPLLSFGHESTYNDP